MDVLTAALIVALLVWGGRRIFKAMQQGSARRGREARPGASPDNPLVVKDAQTLENARQSLRCDCGGEVQELGETPRMGLRVARGRCRECERDVDLYFVLGRLLN